MDSTRPEDPKSRIPFLLRCAFRAAERGDEKNAWQNWRRAIRIGYVVSAKTERELRYEINKWRRDNCPPPHPAPAKEER